MTLTMFDDVTASLIPRDATHVAYYVDGRFANLNTIRQQCPHATLLPILTHPGQLPDLHKIVGAENGVAVDIEGGDWTPAEAAPVIRQIHAEGFTPVPYSSVSLVPTVVAALASEGLHRGDVRIWSAHYIGLHICSPHCWAQLAHTAWGALTADGTQGTDTALGHSLDESLLDDNFFARQHTPSVKHATGLRNMVLTYNADPPHGHNWTARAEQGNFSPGSIDHWASCEVQVNTKTGAIRLRGLPFNAPPLG